MRIAVPIWGNKVSPVLDTASKLLILESLGPAEISRREAYLNEQEISRRCFRIRKLGVDVLICGAISRAFADLLQASGIDIIQGISGKIEEILEAYLNGTLLQTKFLMPGYKSEQMDRQATD